MAPKLPAGTGAGRSGPVSPANSSHGVHTKAHPTPGRIGTGTRGTRNLWGGGDGTAPRSAPRSGNCRRRRNAGRGPVSCPASAAPADGRAGRPPSDPPYGHRHRPPRPRAVADGLPPARRWRVLRDRRRWGGPGSSRPEGGRPPSRAVRSDARSARHTGRSSGVRRRWRAGRGPRSSRRRRTSASLRQDGRKRCANSDVQGSRRWTVPHS